MAHGEFPLRLAVCRGDIGRTGLREEKRTKHALRNILFDRQMGAAAIVAQEKTHCLSIATIWFTLFG